VNDLFGRTVRVCSLAAACMLFISKADAQQPLTAAPPDPVIAGAKAGADNAVLTLSARGSSKFRFNLRGSFDERGNSAARPM